jgi:tRNA G10  N-methylase Trm11
MLVTQLGATVDQAIEDMEPREIDFILTNFAKYLKYYLKRNFEEARESNLKESPFDAIINDNLNLDN